MLSFSFSLLQFGLPSLSRTCQSLANRGEGHVTWFITFIAHLLLGGVFVAYGVRNTRHVERLSGILAKRPFPLARPTVRFGVGLQIAGGALTVPLSKSIAAGAPSTQRNGVRLV